MATCYVGRMAIVRALLATIIVTFVIVGPALFMASSPCFDCDGVCGAGITIAAPHVHTVLVASPLKADSRQHAFSLALRPSELPPRPLFATV